jgi:hypothetical protein
LWAFNPKSDYPLTGPLAVGALPAQFDEKTTLLGVQALIPVNPARVKEPGYRLHARQGQAHRLPDA